MSWKAWTELNHDAANLNKSSNERKILYYEKFWLKQPALWYVVFQFLKEDFINLSSLQNELIDRGIHKTNRVVFLTSFIFLA